MSKILVVQYGPDEEIYPLMSLVIGLLKTFPKAHITWAGDPRLSDLIKYNKRIKRFLDIEREFSLKTLQLVFGTDICVNASFSTIARQFASQVQAKATYGFAREGATNRSSEFFYNVMHNNISTNKTLLQMYYDIANLRWSGEGYGLSYYPKTKQSEQCGSFFSQEKSIENCKKINMPQKLLPQLDTLNRYEEIVTDDLMVAHSGIALRKKCTLYADLPYKMEFFGKGTLHNIAQ